MKKRDYCERETHKKAKAKRRSQQNQKRQLSNKSFPRNVTTCAKQHKTSSVTESEETGPEVDLLTIEKFIIISRIASQETGPFPLLPLLVLLLNRATQAKDYCGLYCTECLSQSTGAAAISVLFVMLGRMVKKRYNEIKTPIGS